MMLSMDRNSVILVSLLAVTLQKQANLKMPVWSMWVTHRHKGHRPYNRIPSVCSDTDADSFVTPLVAPPDHGSFSTLKLQLFINSDVSWLLYSYTWHSFKTQKEIKEKYQILTFTNDIKPVESTMIWQWALLLIHCEVETRSDLCITICHSVFGQMSLTTHS